MACRDGYIPEYEEADMGLYVCSACNAERHVAEEWDLQTKSFFPANYTDAECDCGASMDRKGENNG